MLLFVFHDLPLSALEEPTCKQSAALLVLHCETSPVSVSDMSSGPLCSSERFSCWVFEVNMRADAQGKTGFAKNPRCINKKPFFIFIF